LLSILPKFAEENTKHSVSETHLLSGKVPAKDGSGFAWHVCVVHKEDVDSVRKASFYESSSSHVYALYQGSKADQILPECSLRLDEVGHKYVILIIF